MYNIAIPASKKFMYLKLSLLFFSALLLCSCAGKTVQVPGQDVSFRRPPSDWKVTLFTSTSTTPAGGFLPIKLFKGNWTKSNLSSIGITGSNISGIKTKGSTRKGLLNALESEIKEFKKVCRYVNHHVIKEKSGSLRQGIDYTTLEASVLCYLANPDVPLKARTVIYVLESPSYLYTLQFKAPEKTYEQDFHVFTDVMNSITFEEY
jgi:hypothetical protein